MPKLARMARQSYMADLAELSYGALDRGAPAGPALGRDPTMDSSERRRLIPATCRVHGAMGFCNVVVRKVDGQVELDPHVDQSCVLRFDEAAASMLLNTFIEFLG